MLDFKVDGTSVSKPLHFEPTRIYNLGSATRNTAAAAAHQEEVRDIGVRIAFDRPAPRIYPMDPAIVVTRQEIGVLNPKTSGEVEIVLVVADDLYIGVGSDHTDRMLEKTSILWSKQACANVIAPTLWKFSDVAAHWDQCRLKMSIDGTPYQDVETEVFLRPPEILRILGERLRVKPVAPYMVFCGTYASLDKTIHFGTEWRFSLHDPVLGRTIEHAYRTVDLLEEIEPNHRVPLQPSTN